MLVEIRRHYQRRRWSNDLPSLSGHIGCHWTNTSRSTGPSVLTSSTPDRRPRKRWRQVEQESDVEALVHRAQSLPRNAARSAWMPNRQYEENLLGSPSRMERLFSFGSIAAPYSSMS